MNVPGIVKKTFDELRDLPEFKAIYDLVLEGLSKLSSPMDKARFVHQSVDQLTVDIFSHPIVRDLSPCKLGCTACCHTQVSVTEEEALLLVNNIHGGVEIDKSRLELQMKVKNDHEAFYKLSYVDRKCIFLDQNGGCKVYEDRPSVCRTNAVLGSPSQCDTTHGIQPIRLVKTPLADMAIYGHFSSSNSSGTLPYMVGKVLGIDS